MQFAKMTWRLETFNADVTMASPTIQNSENFAGQLALLYEQTNLGPISSTAVVAMINLAFSLSPIRSWNDKPADIHVKNWDKMRRVYDKPG